MSDVCRRQQHNEPSQQCLVCTVACWAIGCWAIGCWVIGCWDIGCWAIGCWAHVLAWMRLAGLLNNADDMLPRL